MSFAAGHLLGHGERLHLQVSPGLQVSFYLNIFPTSSSFHSTLPPFQMFYSYYIFILLHSVFFFTELTALPLSSVPSKLKDFAYKAAVNLSLFSFKAQLALLRMIGRI